MNFQALSDSHVLTTLGERIRGTRLRRNMTQKELGEQSGLSLKAIQNLESGRGRLDSLVAVLRVLRQLDSLNAFLPEPGISPLDLARRQGKVRERAASKYKITPDDPANTDEQEPW
jgi:transcriptional regulator with XRE-family HTH domain